MLSLNERVRNRVNDFVESRRAFTTVDISHPIINDDPTVRHRQIREVIEEMLTEGYFDEVAYTTTNITVHPQPGQDVGARLFHPDEPGFDVDSYTKVSQELHRRSVNKIAVTKVTDEASTVAIQHRSTVRVQQRECTLNIPKKLVVGAGLKEGDRFTISFDGTAIRIEKTMTGNCVDAEGRIRIHGMQRYNKMPGDACNVAVLSSSSILSTTYIQIT